MSSIPEPILDRYTVMIEDLGISAEVAAPDPGTDLSHLRWMLGQLRAPMEPGKANRWLGFIQGCLISRGLTTVRAERDFTRPYFGAVPTA